MKELFPRLFIGSRDDYTTLPDKEKWVFVHAAASFFDKVKHDNLEKTKGFIESKNELYLNWLDTPDETQFSVEQFNTAFHFIDFYLQNNEKKCLIHCDFGQSRSASLVLFYLAKRTTILPNSFFPALKKFKELYPDYVYPSGISRFIKKNWKVLDRK